MSQFKIGDKVKFKGATASLGYVSHVHKGQLFEFPDYEVQVHLGNKEHLTAFASDLEVCNDE